MVFCHMIADFEPNSVDVIYVSEVVIPEIHAKVKHRITELLQSAKYISLTTDIWTGQVLTANTHF